MATDKTYLLSPAHVASSPEYWVDHHRVKPAGYKMQPHTHPQCEVALVTDGSCTYMSSGSIVHLEKGVACFMPSGVPHAVWAGEQEGFTLAVLHFPSLPNELHAALIGETKGIRLSELDQSKYLSICLQIEQELAGDLPGIYMLCNALVIQLLVLLHRSSKQAQSGASTNTQKQIVSSALQWMHAHLSDDIQVDDIAAHVAVSPAHLRRLFKAEVGLTPKQYLINLRIEKSKGLLIDSELSIAAVAHMSGFEPKQFARIFQARTHLTATEWRNAYSRIVPLHSTSEK